METIPTPRSNLIKSIVLNTFKQWKDGKIYAEDVSERLSMVMADVAKLERELTIAKRALEEIANHEPCDLQEFSAIAFKAFNQLSA